MPHLTIGNKLLQRLSGLPYINRWFVFVFDVVVSCLCTLGSYLLLCRLLNRSALPGTALLMCGVSLVTATFGFLLFKTYKNIIRHSSFQSVWRVAAALTIKTVVVTAVYFINETFISIYRLMMVVMFDWLLSFSILVAVRLVLVLFYNYTIAGALKLKQKVLIYGLSPNDITLTQLLNLNTQSDYTIAGFLCFGNKHDTYTAGNLPVYMVERTSSLWNIIEKEDLQGILFTRQEDILKERNRLVAYCLEKQLKMFTVPPIGNWQQTTPPALHNLDISDLLGRDEIRINTELIKQTLKDKTVLVTGAAGSIGSELCRNIAEFQVKKLVLFDNCETGLHNLRLELEEKFPHLTFAAMIGDVRIRERLKFVFERHHPQIVFHAAAYKHVPLMEENPNEAFLVNTIGTRNIAHASLEYNVEKFLMVSTDKAVNPTNVMGASKRMAEIYVQSLNQAVKEGLVQGNTRFITTRFGNVLGSQGSVIPLFKAQIEKGGPLTVTHPDITRYFMTIKEACLLMLEASVIGNGGDILVFDMGTPVKIADLAKKMILISGRGENDIKIKFTGLRPGEKLYEEVLSSVEHTLPTSHEKIRIAKAESFAFGDLQTPYTRLEDSARNCRSDESVKIAKEVVREYISNNSEYAKFDRK